MSQTTASKTPSQGQPIDLNTLPIEQLSQLQSRLSAELEHLTASYQRLRSAQNRFRDCIRSIKEGVQDKSLETTLLVPLTTSLYVPGTLASNSKVLVDVGTGFYVEKTTKDATKFYTGKVEELNKNLGDIERIVGQKNDTLRVVEDVLRQKVLSERGPGGGSGGTQGKG